MISVRLTQEEEHKLNQVAKEENMSKTDIIKRALMYYFDERRERKTAYDLGEDFFGRHGSGKGNLSEDYKTIVKERLREKHSR
ncbi:MAG TPA: ribbon-helix-helix protein, CopG family [Spirochaetota bacterium]|nr:ribbon-helix-helix protein, CopG family [Spirochaetota bacterium]HQO03654.1 ribbon-helix-helix protein, CopG family [Spirochaetota bacterium]HQP48866.1 ribbon-helix-helix protein, CopG family [Spirochaetota bacterium]